MSKLILLVALFAQEEARSRRVFADLPADGVPAIAGQAVPWKDLAAALKRQAGSGVRELVLRVDGSVPFSSVQELMSAAREAGIEGVQFSTEKAVAPLRISDDARRTLRIKIREGAKGLEVLVLQEASAVSLDDLRAKLKRLDKAPVVVDADFEVPYGAVRQIVSACTEEGFDKVSFAGPARKAGAVRVLYAEETPRWEYRYLRNALERSLEFKLDVTLATADPDFPGVLSAFPKDLSSYDVVLMGGLKELAEDRRKALAEFVGRGGGIVWMAPGADFPTWLGHSLETLCPVKVSGLSVIRGDREHVRLAVKDPSSPLAAIVDWKDLSKNDWIEWSLETVDPDARIVVAWEPTPEHRALWEQMQKREAQERGGRKAESAILVTQPVGKGRSAFVSVTNTYAWREHAGDRPHFAPFWTGVLRWAAGR